MEISVVADELFDEYKQQIAHMNHELILERVKNRKLAEKLQEFQRAESDRVHMARRQLAVQPPAAPQSPEDGPALTRASVEAPEPPPLPPGPDSGPSRA